MGALNTAGKVTFLPEDSPFSEYTDISGRAHAWKKKSKIFILRNIIKSTQAPTKALKAHLQKGLEFDEVDSA